MDILLQSTISGISLGCVYALVALGFVLIYKSTQVVNFAQGELMMVSAYIHFSFVTFLGMTPIIAFGLTLICSAILGAVIERLVMHPLIDEQPFTLVMATIGLAWVLRAATGMIWTHDTHAFPSPIPSTNVDLAGINVSWVDIWSVGLTITLSILLYGFFKHTRTGTALRAVAQNRYAAQLMGISAQRMFTLTWALAATVGAAGGMILADISYLHTNMGFIGLRAFPAMLLGGMDSIVGALLGGLVIGLAENVSGAYLGGSVKEIVPYIILLVVLLIRPTGFFGSPEDKRV